MHNDDENIIFIVRRGPDTLGVFSTIGTAITGAEHMLKGDSHGDVVVIINTREFGNHVARVVLNDTELRVFAILIDDNHTIDGINILRLED